MKRSNLNVVGRLLTLVRPLMPLMLVAIVMGAAGYLCSILIPVFGGLGLLRLLPAQGGLPLTAVFITAAVCAALRGVLRYAEQATNHYIAFKLLAVIRDKVFTALRRLSPAKLDGREKGNLISIITTDIELLEVFYAHTISPTVIGLAVSVMMTVFLAQYHWLLALIALAGYAVMGILVPLLISKIGKSTGRAHQKEFGQLNSFFLDHLRGLKELIQYSAGGETLGEINSRTASLEEKQKKLKHAEGLTGALSNTIILLFSVTMLFASLALYRQGKIGFNGVLIPTITMMSSFGPVTALANLANNLLHTFAAGNRVLDILDESPVVAEVTGGKETAFDGVQCSHVDFSYGQEQILSDFSLRVQNHETVGIVGKSGSGKSTLLKLMMRFLDVDQGKIEISGTDIRDLNTACLRGMEGYVTQETELFHDSIKNNIRIARLDATEEEIVDACKKASLHSFILTLPQGYDTPVGELGESLSGGERQRIGVARAFLHHAPLILLDEPTSNLDSLNEAVILKSLKEEAADKAVVFVSHRPSAMSIADRVYTVENGRMS